MSRKQTPNDFLKQIIGRPVVVKLNSGVDYRGVYLLLFFVFGYPTFMDSVLNSYTVLVNF